MKKVTVFGALLLVLSCGQKKSAQIYLLEGACEVQVKTDDKHSDIYVDAILIGHGQASTRVPCGEKKITVEAPGKWTIDEYRVVESRLPLEVTYKLRERKAGNDWAMSAELIDQLREGKGPLDLRNPKHKEFAQARAKKREEEGYYYTSEELAASARKSLGTSDSASGGATDQIQIDPNTNFDDPKTWM